MRSIYSLFGSLDTAHGQPVRLILVVDARVAAAEGQIVRVAAIDGSTTPVVAVRAGSAGRRSTATFSADPAACGRQK